MLFLLINIFYLSSNKYNKNLEKIKFPFELYFKNVKLLKQLVFLYLQCLNLFIIFEMFLKKKLKI